MLYYLYRIHFAMSGIRTQTTLVVIDTDYMSSCKLNYHTIMTTAAPYYLLHYTQHKINTTPFSGKSNLNIHSSQEH